MGTAGRLGIGAIWGIALWMAMPLAAGLASAQEANLRLEPPGQANLGELDDGGMAPGRGPSSAERSPWPLLGPADRRSQTRAAEGREWTELERLAGTRCVYGADVAIPPYPEPAWYTRVDYFHWNERLDGADFVNEHGALVTLGYVRRVGRERFRFELFGGDVHYDGGAMFEDGTSEPLTATTGYLGVRGEYDLLFEPDCLPAVSLLAGIGTRLWVRDLRGGTTSSGIPVFGYQETWWSVYPYIGVEKRRAPGGLFEFYWGGRIGCTPINYQYATWFDVPVYPRIGITGQAEAGVRGDWLFLAAFFEAMTWSQSNVAQDSFQPDSRMLTVGVKAGVSF